VRYFVTEVPLFIPGVILSVAVAVVLAPAVSRALGGRAVASFLLIASFGIAVSATLTPLLGSLESGVTSTGTCDLDGLGLAPFSVYLRPSEASLNVLLFVPLGFAVGLLPYRRQTAIVAAAALALPFAIELAQMLLPMLGRGCEGADVIHNVLGVTIGIGVGAAARVVASYAGRAPDRVRRASRS
jgi:glycopeptide antibiotics resistance protein